MEKEKVIQRIMKCQQRNELGIILEKICFHAAPTLHKIKPASLISFRNSRKIALKDSWDYHKKDIRKLLKVEFLEVNRLSDGVVVLFYWEDLLKKLLEEKETIDFLKSIGYKETQNLKPVLEELKTRFQDQCPHEIGIFLGYPLQDVIVFYYKKNDPCLAVGYWKVYYNLANAELTFEAYDKAREKVIQALNNGMKPEKLLQLYAA